MANEVDPIEQVLRDLSQMRGRAHNDLLRLPAPSPFKRGLQEVDRILGGVEDDIRRVHAGTTSPIRVLGTPFYLLPFEERQQLWRK